MSDQIERPPGQAEPLVADTVTGIDELERLRRLILPTELDRLDAVEQRLDDPEVRAEELSRVVPDAVARAARRDNRLGVALSTVVDEALAVSVKKHRKHLADVLSPAMGPAIRRAIAETLRAMVDSFNQVLQHSFSARALRWRLEAWQTGKPFAEVVLSHSLIYRVEQVFLVHRETGLLLQHVAADASTAQDADLLSGMLTAIRDLACDTLSAEPDRPVDMTRIGDKTVWVEQGEKAYIAAVIRGDPPTRLRSVLRDALDTIHLELGEAFDTFSGDATLFEDARRHLEGCLQMHLQGRTQTRRWLAPAITAAIAAALLATWAFFDIRSSRRWNAYLARLASEPGIVVVNERRGIRHSKIRGLRDPDAADPVRLLSAYGLTQDRVASSWEPYLSQAPAIAVARARSWLQPPATVRLRSVGAVVVATGSAPHRWLLEATRRAANLPGVREFDARGVTDEGMAAVDAAQQRLARLALRFPSGSAALPGGQQSAVESVVALLQELSRQVDTAGIAVRIDVIGHTDGTGAEGNNFRLSRARAERVLSAIQTPGVSHLKFAIAGVGSTEPLRAERGDEDRAANRSVTFRLVVEQ